MKPEISSTTWDSLAYKLEPWLQNALISLGFTTMTPVQASTIPLLSQHKDVVVEAVTGSGKTLAYVIPVLEKIIKLLKEEELKKGYFGAMIVAPTRELADQIDNVIQSILALQPENQKQIKSQRLVGSIQSVREDLSTFVYKKPQILVGTPGRLIDFLSNNSVKTSKCEILIFDEADKLLDIGFINDTQTIVRYLPTQRRTGLFSATISGAGNEIFKTGMTNPVKVTVKSKSMNSVSAPESLNLSYIVVDPQQKLKILLEMIIKFRFKKVIVYFPTNFAVTQFYSFFCKLVENHKDLTGSDQLEILSLHGKLEAKPRLRTLTKFAEGYANKTVLFTTDVAARGLDIPDVDLVIQLDPPTEPDVFLHRCGRTGRANKIGNAITMLSEGREEDYVNFLNVKNIVLRLQETPEVKKESNEWFDKQLKNWLLEDRIRYDHAIRCYVSYARYYSKHVASSIFRLSELDYLKLAKLHGLCRFPKMPENKYIKDFPEDGWFDNTINFDTYSYKDPAKEEARLVELKTERRKRERKEKALLKKELKEKNSSWSKKVEGKENKQERHEKLLKRREAVEAEIKRQREGEDSEESEAEVDWKDLVRANKKQKNIKQTEGFFDDL
jgi:ATP-dependent RNA helicase DDX55/SPB4